ncbi:PRD domain-containing protein [Paenibacillus sp. FSL L8-0158]
MRLKIKNKIEQVYGKTIPNEELAYLAVHIESLTRSIRLANLEVL